MALRRLGLTYSEIQAIIPVPNSTLSNWSRDVPLSTAQIDAIRVRSGPETQRGIPRDTQWRSRVEVAEIRTDARSFAISRLNDADFVGGVALYWGEGAKTRNRLELSNADPAALRAFVNWVRRYLDEDATFVLSMHLHEGNNESAARAYWSRSLGLPNARFTKTFIKAAGTGHRKNHLEAGVCRVRTLRAGDHWNRVMVWVEVVAGQLGRIEGPPC